MECEIIKEKKGVSLAQITTAEDTIIRTYDTPFF